jgi:hypothetical protein
MSTPSKGGKVVVEKFREAREVSKRTLLVGDRFWTKLIQTVSDPRKVV